MSLGPLDPATRQRLNIGASVRGVAILAVSPQSDAGKQGLSRGDVIVRAGEHMANTPADVAAAVADARRAGRPSVLLLVSHNGRTVALPVKLDSGSSGPAGGAPPR
jgi:serine protease Do